jgi:hypothetical protein
MQCKLEKLFRKRALHEPLDSFSTELQQLYKGDEITKGQRLCLLTHDERGELLAKPKIEKKGFFDTGPYEISLTAITPWLLGPRDTSGLTYEPARDLCLTYILKPLDTISQMSTHRAITLAWHLDPGAEKATYKIRDLYFESEFRDFIPLKEAEKALNSLQLPPGAIEALAEYEEQLVTPFLKFYHETLEKESPILEQRST